MATAPKSLRFVDLEERQIPRILEIEAKCNTAPWSERSFRNELDHPYGIFRVALVEGQIVGYGGIWMVIDEAHVTTVAVDPDHRRQGIARRLMNELLIEARAKGARCSTLEVRAGNEPAILLYEDLGYVRTAVRKGYYPDNREDAVVMWLHDLSPWDA